MLPAAPPSGRRHGPPRHATERVTHAIERLTQTAAAGFCRGCGHPPPQSPTRSYRESPGVVTPHFVRLLPANSPVTVTAPCDKVE